MLTLSVTARGKESADTLRKGGSVPAVFYGPKEEATSIAIDARALERVWHEAGETSIVTLKGLGDDKDTLIHDAQFHPVTGKMLHVDFYVLEKGKKIRIKVPLEFTGSAPAEKAGGVVVKALHEVEIEVAPAELPKHLAVDLGVLQNVGDHISVAQIKLPASASLITHGEEIIASATAFVEEKEEVTPAPETVILTAKPEAAAAEGAAPAAEEKKEKKAE
jgi:large subunit ribosomal protein L25